MTDPKSLIVVGQIAGAFGVRGEVRVRSFTDDPEAIFDYGPLLDAAGKVVLTPVRHRSLNDLFSVTAKEALQREAWEAMRGTLLHAPRAALPEADEGEIYVADLIGARVVHVDGRELGVVKTVQNFGAGRTAGDHAAHGRVLPAALHRREFPRARHGRSGADGGSGRCAVARRLQHARL